MSAAVLLVAVGVILLRERQLHNLAPTKVVPQPFALREWESGNATRRISMGYHIAASGEFVGLSRDELISRLGAPSAADGRRLEWFLGNRQSAGSMMFTYREHLNVLLDENGRCAFAQVVTRD